jgi:hypothetical protein
MARPGCYLSLQTQHVPGGLSVTLHPFFHVILGSQGDGSCYYCVLPTDKWPAGGQDAQLLRMEACFSQPAS